jgi:diacylglycerol kinase (ATP)
LRSATLVFSGQVQESGTTSSTACATRPAKLTIIALAIVVILVIATKALTGRGTPLRGGLPSGHAAVAFAAWMAVTQMLDPTEHRFLISMIMLGVASLVAYSRIETGIHSALEVVYGGVLGAGVTLIVFQLFF